MSVVAIYFNKTNDKSEFDCVKIIPTNNAESFHVKYNSSESSMTIASFISSSKEEVLRYIETSLNLMISDKDKNPHVGVDVTIPGFPVVCLQPNEYSKQLILTSLGLWLNMNQ